MVLLNLVLLILLNWEETWDVAVSRSRRDHRKSKFGPWTSLANKSNRALWANEVRILIFDDSAKNERGQRPGSGSREGKLSNPCGRAGRAMHEFFSSKIYEIPRSRAAWAPCASFLPLNSYNTRVSHTHEYSSVTHCTLRFLHEVTRDGKIRNV